MSSPPPPSPATASADGPRPAAIGFPAPLLGATSLRLPVVAQGPGWLVLDKPPGPAPSPDPWWPTVPDLATALRTQLAAAKPELLRLGLSDTAHAIVAPEPEASGATLFASTDAAGVLWRNLLGAHRLRCGYACIAWTPSAGATPTTLTCDLPLARHRERPCAVVSHRTGRRTQTTFTLVETLGPFQLWQATTTFPRPHQVRCHAAELGLSLVGESLYTPPADRLLPHHGQQAPWTRLALPILFRLSTLTLAPEVGEEAAPGPLDLALGPPPLWLDLQRWHAADLLFPQLLRRFPVK